MFLNLKMYTGKKIQVEKTSFKPNYSVRQVFSSEEEKMLANYFIQTSKLHHGLPPLEAKKLAYEFAVSLEKNIPDSWRENKEAGKDWLDGFLSRVCIISLRKPEATSLARSMSFNKPVVTKFYDDLYDLMQKHRFGPENIYNLDETGVTSFQTPGKVLAEKGSKQVGQVTSAERGELVTLCCTINALGNAIPPFFIFPRVNFRTAMLNGAPLSSNGAATLSGWMNSDIFVTVMDHFIKFSKSSLQNKTLLIMDNHESHVSIKVINMAKENGIVLFTLPPHCSHKLQPLDKAVFGPFKRFYNDSCRAWLVNNPGKRITIHEIAGLVGKAYPLAFSSSNILAGFARTGIFPFDKNVYKDEDFVASKVTDVDVGSVAALESPQVVEAQAPTFQSDFDSLMDDITVPGPSHAWLPHRALHMEGNSGMASCLSEETEQMIVCLPRTTPLPAKSENLKKTPEMIRPLPKASLQVKNITKKRQPKKSEVLTDTPVKARLEREAAERLAKKTKPKNIKAEKPPKKQKVVQQLYQDSSTEKEEWKESSSDEALDFDLEEEDYIDDKKPEVGDFVLVKVTGKKKGVYRHYIAEVMKTSGQEYEVKYMKRIVPSYSFIFDEEETYHADSSDIVRKLPKPTVILGTERTTTKLTFSVNFESYNVH